MLISGKNRAHLTYCLNIHPGESWADNLKAIKEYTLSVKKKVCPNKDFGLGLRLSDHAARELGREKALKAFKSFLKNNGLYVFTVNAFPYGNFSSGRIKEDVYEPDWSSHKRVEYTLRVAQILAKLLPDGVEGSISTVPLGYTRKSYDINKMTKNILDCAYQLSLLSRKTGKIISIALEPEPDCILQNTNGLVSFLSEKIYGAGALLLAQQHGLNRHHAERILQKHLGVCLDTCHLSVQFEDPEISLERLRRCGIKISKVQISSALRTMMAGNWRKNLSRFQDERYLHQVRIKESGKMIRCHADLEPDDMQEVKNAEIRVHYHVPLYFTSFAGIGSTSGDLTPGFFAAARKVCSQFEIETYTFDVLPATVRKISVVDSIVKEYRWVMGRLN